VGEDSTVYLAPMNKCATYGSNVVHTYFISTPVGVGGYNAYVYSWPDSPPHAGLAMRDYFTVGAPCYWWIGACVCVGGGGGI